LAGRAPNESKSKINKEISKGKEIKTKEVFPDLLVPGDSK